MVTSEINEELTRPIGLNEIQHATFPLGDLKAPRLDGFAILS